MQMKNGIIGLDRIKNIIVRRVRKGLVELARAKVTLKKLCFLVDNLDLGSMIRMSVFLMGRLAYMHSLPLNLLKGRVLIGHVVLRSQSQSHQ